ncbi:LuxR C-terminal-related transcriptional regulator [Aquimarina sp. 2201CG1-2-11]|uniref:LuxR C-terminal-related transcriptional regulator n=1 Tax=Aquimarina discodermiae TaxID=3231043 RepID=UPI0034624FAD
MDLITELLRSKHDLDSFAKKIPCILHINEIKDFRVLYLDPYTREKLGITDTKELNKTFLSRIHLHPDDLEVGKASCLHYLEHVEEFSTFSFVQRVKFNEEEYRSIFVTTLLMEELGGLVSFSVDLGGHEVQEKGLDQIIYETEFIKKRFIKFGALTVKERSFIRFWIQDFSNTEIAQKLGLTEQTVKTYKKKIYKKLDIHTFHQLHEYASAFDITN